MIRCFLLCVAVLFIAGCSRGLGRLPPAGATARAEVLLFTDGFHSGIMLERRVLTPELDPRTAQDAPDRVWRSFHFGEERWTTGADMSMLHACRLAFIPGPGVIQSDATGEDATGIPALDREEVRLWRFSLSAVALEALLARLRQEWIDGSVVIRVDPGLPTVLFPARHRWSVWTNCHDFTADVMEAAGLDLARHGIATAGTVAGDIDNAVEDLREGGITVVTP